MGGGGAFPTCTIIFSQFFACVDNFFFKSSLARIFFFLKKVLASRDGGGGLTFFQDTKKNGSKKFCGLTSIKLRYKKILPHKFFLKHA
jgi:hypothetical protein